MKKKFLLTLLLSFMLMFTLTACGKVSVTDIEISNQKTEFAYGEEFSLGEGFEIKAKLDDESTRVLIASEYEVNSSSYNKMVAGTYTIVISYKQDTNIKVSYDVVVKDKVMSGIAVSTTDAPKATYIQGQSLDLSVGKLIVSYEVGQADVINLNAEGVVVTGFDSTTPVNGQVLTVSYAGKNTTFTVNILAKEVVSISIKDAPKSSYYVGDDMDRASGSIEVTYNDGSKETIALSDSGVSINGFDTTSAKVNHEVFVTYAGQTAKYTINVVEPVLQSIELVAPTKAVYFIGETISLVGGKIVATYDNGSVDIALTDPRVSVSGFNSSAEVTGQVVTVTFAGLSKTFTVNIIRKSASEIAMATQPTKVEYYVGDTIDLSGATIDVNYNDGSEDTIALTDSSVTILGFDSSVANNELVVTVKVDDVTVTFTVKIYARAVQSIQIKAQPAKVRYFVGEDLDLTGLEVEALYQLHTEDVDLEDVEITGFDSSAAAEDQVVTITYAGKTATFVVDIINKSVESIAMKTSVTKVNYYVGDTLDIAGGEIEVSYDDNSKETIALSETGVAVTGFDSTTAGEKEVTVTYKEKTTTFVVMVYTKEVKSIEIVNTPTKVTYFVGETLNTNGIEVKAIYQLHEEIVDNSELSFTGFDSTSANNEVVVTVTYNGKTATFTVSVIEKSATSIEINEAPITTYYVNDEIDLSVGSIKVNYNDGSHEFIDLDAEGVEVTGFDSSVAAEELELTITYKELTTTYMVEVIAKVPALIAVNDDVKRIYVLDSEFDNKGTIKVYYEGGKSEEIALSTQGVEVTGFDSTTTTDELEITVTYQDLTSTYTIRVVEELQVINLVVYGFKTEYFYLEEFDYTQGSGIVTYEDGSTKAVVANELYVGGIGGLTPGKHTIFVYYQGVSAGVEILIKQKVYTDIELDIEKTEYYKGQELDLSYIKAIVTSNAGEEEISGYSDDIVITGYDFNQLGTQTLTLTYYTLSATFNINVVALQASEVSNVVFGSTPEITTYEVGDTEVNVSGGDLYVYLENGNTIYIEMECSDVTVSSFDFSEAGYTSVQLSYLGYSVEYEVEVVENRLNSITVYTEGVNYNEYYFENDGSNHFELELDGEFISDIWFDTNGYNGYWEYEINNVCGEFTIICNYVTYNSGIVMDTATIDVVITNLNLLDANFSFEMTEGEIEYDEDTGIYNAYTFCENIAFIGPDKYLYNGNEYDGNEIQEIDFAVGEYDIEVYFWSGSNTNILVELKLHVLANTVSVIKFDGQDYYTTPDIGDDQGRLLFEVERGSEHTVQLIYNDTDYIAIVNEEAYESGDDINIALVNFMGGYSHVDAKLYDRAEYEDYLVRYEEFKIALEAFQNGMSSEYPEYPNMPDYKQEFWVGIMEEDYIKDVKLTVESAFDFDVDPIFTYDYYANNNQPVLSEYFGFNISGLVDDIEIEMEEGYTYELLINNKKDGFYYEGENELQVLVYNANEELIRVVPFVLGVSSVNYELTINDQYYHNEEEIYIATVFDENNPRIYYNMDLGMYNSKIKTNIHFGDIDTPSRTGSKLNGWYNYDLGYQEIYFSFEGENGSRSYVKVNLYVAEQMNGNDVFQYIKCTETEFGMNIGMSEVSQMIFVGGYYTVELPVGATAENLTLLGPNEEDLGATFTFIENGKVLKVEVTYQDEYYVAYYLVIQNPVTDITDFNVTLVDLSSGREDVYSPSEITVVNDYVGNVIFIETLDIYAKVTVSDNKNLVYVTSNAWMFANEGEFTVTFTVTPANGDTSKQRTITINFNITLSEIFSVDFGDEEYHAYLGLQTLHPSSDFKILSVQYNEDSPYYILGGDITEDKLTITTEDDVRYATIDIAHPGMEYDIRVFDEPYGTRFESLEDVKFEIKTTSKGYDYIDFTIEYANVYMTVIIFIAEFEGGLTLELQLGEDKVSVSAYEVETGLFYGDFMAVNMGGMVMAEAIITNPDFANQEVPPTTISGKVSNLGTNMLIFGTMDMGTGTPNFENMVTPENQNNLTLDVMNMGQGVYVIMGMLMTVDLGTGMPTSQTMLIVTISATGLSMFTMMAY